MTLRDRQVTATIVLALILVPGLVSASCRHAVIEAGQEVLIERLLTIPTISGMDAVTTGDIRVANSTIDVDYTFHSDKVVVSYRLDHADQIDTVDCQ